MCLWVGLFVHWKNIENNTSVLAFQQQFHLFFLLSDLIDSCTGLWAVFNFFARSRKSLHTREGVNLCLICSRVWALETGRGECWCSGLAWNHRQNRGYRKHREWNESGMRGKEIEEMNFKKAAKPGLHSALCILASLGPFNSWIPHHKRLVCCKPSEAFLEWSVALYVKWF